VDDRALEADLRARPLFDPEAGVTIAVATGGGPGYWAGAPGALVADGVVVLAYRLRAPAPRRGHTVVVATSPDGVRFEPVWQMSRDDLGALSIERCAVVRAERKWRVLVSFVDERDGKWRIEAIEGATIERLDPRSRRPVLAPDEIRVAAVKDPWIRRVGSAWYLFASFGPLPTDAGAELHATGDALSTGRTGSLTGLAASRDGETWEWRGAVLGPTGGRWDGYTARLSTAIRIGDGWLGLYDGSTLEGNYEERCGIAFSDDLIEWRKTGANGPLIGTASGPGGVRYVDVIEMPHGTMRAYYEWTRPDGSHELRTALARKLLHPSVE
jgi:hypothetical protein